MMEIPRALSVDVDSPHYRPDFASIGQWLDILLDGKVMTEVTTYDMDAGLIVRAQTDADGNLMVNDARDAVLLETLHGEVTVVVRDVAHGEES